MVKSIGNLVHESVPVDNNEDNNVIVKTWGEPSKMVINSTKGKCHHHEILAMIGGYDPKRGQKIAGHRGYFLKGPGVLLNMALVNYGV
jgi:seryl-tRNA synthetase